MTWHLQIIDLPPSILSLTPACPLQRKKRCWNAVFVSAEPWCLVLSRLCAISALLGGSFCFLFWDHHCILMCVQKGALCLLFTVCISSLWSGLPVFLYASGCLFSNWVNLIRVAVSCRMVSFELNIITFAQMSHYWQWRNIRISPDKIPFFPLWCQKMNPCINKINIRLHKNSCVIVLQGACWRMPDHDSAHIFTWMSTWIFMYWWISFKPLNWLLLVLQEFWSKWRFLMSFIRSRLKILGFTLNISKKKQTLQRISLPRNMWHKKQTLNTMNESSVSAKKAFKLLKGFFSSWNFSLVQHQKRQLKVIKLYFLIAHFLKRKSRNIKAQFIMSIN